MSIFSSVVLLSKCEMPLIPFVWLSVSGEVMKLSTNHAHEKTTWLEALQTPGQSPKLRQHSEKSGVTSPSPWVERHPVSLSERTFSKSSPPRSDSFGSPPNSATPKGSLSTSGVHSQVKVQVSTNGWVCSYKCTNLVFFFFSCDSPPAMGQSYVQSQHRILLLLIWQPSVQLHTVLTERDIGISQGSGPLHHFGQHTLWLLKRCWLLPYFVSCHLLQNNIIYLHLSYFLTRVQTNLYNIFMSHAIFDHPWENSK